MRVESKEQNALNAITQVVRTRRTVKPEAMDADRPLDRVLLGELLENATWAPTHGLTQPWRFFVHEGDSRAVLAAQLQDIYRTEVKPPVFREDKLEKLGKNPVLAPCVIAVGVSAIPGGKIPMEEEVEAVACALQNLMLSASAAGLGSFWSSPLILASPAMSSYLGMDGELDRCVGLLYLGWPKEGTPEPTSVRDRWESKVVWMGDGENTE